MNAAGYSKDAEATRGYATAASFSRAFRQAAGCWPTENRSKMQVV